MGKRYRNRRGQVVSVGLAPSAHNEIWTWRTPWRGGDLTLYGRARAWAGEAEAQSALDAHAARMGWEEVPA
jgi:hypothetical protein